MPVPFDYPTAHHVRRHWPLGYAEYRAFKPWLRDEFTFRCVYCLHRERWQPRGSDYFGVEHILPKSSHPSLECEYENLLYACNGCNSCRQDDSITLDPCGDVLARHLLVEDDGTIRGLTTDGMRLIQILRLDRNELTTFRGWYLETVAELRRSASADAPRLLAQLLSFPDDLPNLASLNPPAGNGLSAGVRESAYELRLLGRLPSTY